MKIVIAALLAGLGFGVFDAGISNPSLGVFQVPIGPGLQVTSIDVECDSGYQGCSGSGTSTKVARTDTGNGWIYNPSVTCGNNNHVGCWQPAFTSSSMAGTSVTRCSSCYDAPYEIVIAPSNTSVLYAIYGGDGCFYSSTNKGQTWSNGGNIITGGCTASDPNQPTKFDGPYIAVDPQNSAVVLASTPSSGASYSTNSGSSWTHITTLSSGTAPGPGGSVQGGGTIFAYDPTSSVSGGQKQGIYACTYGVGFFRTTTGPGGTWSAVNGTNSPTDCGHIIVDSAGTVWEVGASQNNQLQKVWSCASPCTAASTWTHETALSSSVIWQTIAVDTNNCASAGACHLVAMDQGGARQYTTTGSGGWGSYASHDETNCPPNGFTAADVPWLQNTNQGNWSIGGVFFDPAQSNVVHLSMGVGDFEFTPSTSATQFCAASVSAAMELGNTNWSIGPPGGHPIITEWDRTGFVISSMTNYPSTQICANSYPEIAAGSVIAGWSVDWVSNTPADIVALCNFGANDLSGISTDGGVHWTQFGSTPSGVVLGAGCITATTPSVILWEDGKSGGVGSGFFVSTNGGSTWSSRLQPGSLTSGWGGGNTDNKQNCGSDRSNGNLYVYNFTGSGADYFFSCSNSCGTVGNWTQKCTNCNGSGGSLFSNASIQMRTINGQANTIYLAAAQGAASGLYKSTDGGATWNATGTSITGISGFGEGKGCGADSYELYVLGSVSSVNGLYRSGDAGATWHLLQPLSAFGSFGLDLSIGLDFVYTVTGDDNVCGTVYVGSHNNGVKQVRWQ